VSNVHELKLNSHPDIDSSE